MTESAAAGRRIRHRHLASPIAVAAAALTAFALPSTSFAAASTVRYRVGAVHDISSACARQNAEVEQAVDNAHHDVYELWMGCGGIGFARSTDGGARFDAPVAAPGATRNSWDPALAVAPDGTLYVAFMTSAGGYTYPVVDASFDHGASFPRATQLIPSVRHNWGDRDFLAVAPDGALYVTWDYGPSAAAIKYICSSNGSCAFAAGDLNVVVQRSADRARTFSSITPISRGFPASGGDSAPLLVEPSGRIDAEYQGYQVTNPRTYALGRAHSYFTWSDDSGRTWSAPVRVGPQDLTMSKSEWWIDGDLTRDSAGNLYITWDSQGPYGDVAWLSYSRDRGATWSPLVRVLQNAGEGPHIVEAAGGGAGIVYVGVLTDTGLPGYAQYLRTFSVSAGWLSAPLRVSTAWGAHAVWPGDTFGISTLGTGRSDGSGGVMLSWGSAVGGANRDSEIYASVVTVRGG